MSLHILINDRFVESSVTFFILFRLFVAFPSLFCLFDIINRVLQFRTQLHYLLEHRQHNEAEEARLRFCDIGCLAIAQETDRQSQLFLTIALAEEFIVQKISPIVHKVETASCYRQVT